MKNTEKLLICHLFTSYYSGRLWPNQMTHPKPNVINRNPMNIESHLNKDKVRTHKEVYFPLNTACFSEAQADHLLSSGSRADSEKAVEKLGVSLTSTVLRWGQQSNQSLRLFIKMQRALRQSQRYEQALQCGMKILKLTIGEIDNNLHLENFIEARLELALTLEALQKEDQNSAQKLPDVRSDMAHLHKFMDPEVLYQEIINMFECSHDIGNTERYTRLIPRTKKLNQQGFDSKWIHYSPYDIDRCYTLMDSSLDAAEKFFSEKNLFQKLEVVLQVRCKYFDKKDLNRRMYTGKIETMRGKPGHRSCRLTSSPTPEEIFIYYPTVHNTYINYRYYTTAPLGQESDVMPGMNRISQDGDPLRRQRKFYRISESRKIGHQVEMQNLQYR